MDEIARNEVSGHVHGPSLQAHVIRGDVHVHGGDARLVAVHEELNRVRAQLVESMQAERSITQVVWVLQTVLMQLQAKIAHLVLERDHQHAELSRARESEAKTEQRLVRAESERANALRLVEIARAKVLALEARGGTSVVPTLMPDAGQVDIGLEMVDRYLDEQGERLELLSAELESPSPRELLTRESAIELIDDLVGTGFAPAVLIADVGEQNLRDSARLVEQHLAGGCSLARFTSAQLLVVCADDVVPGGVEALAVDLLRLLRAGSIGVAAFVRTTEGLIRSATEALALAGAKGTGLAAVARGSGIELLAGNLDQYEQLRACISRGELALHYQPVVDGGGEVLMAEALVRWPSAGQVLAPDVLLPVAERGGMLRDLDIWVLNTALRQAAAWPADISVSINLSGLLPNDPEFVHVVARAIDEAGIAWKRVVLELTEDVVFRDSMRVPAAMMRLTDRGVRFALDTFGSGYSSLAWLRQVPVQIIKIDRSLVRGVDGHHTQRAMVGAVADLASALGCTCIAVGVETREDYLLLKRLGVDACQGWLIAKPMTDAELCASVLDVDPPTIVF